MEKNKNTQALLIGIILIAAISIMAFLRTSNNNERISEEAEKKSNAKNEIIQSSSKISKDELLEKISSEEDMLIIDLRDRLSYEKEHISDSENMSPDSVLEILKSLSKDKYYILVDFGPGNEIAQLLAGKLKSAGFKNAFYLDGGFSKWKDGYYSIVSEGDPNSFTDQSKVKYIQTDALKKMMETEKNLILIDVRDNVQFKEGHLKNAYNIPLASLEQRKKEIPIGRKIILYDETGLAAFKAAVRLFDLGIFNVSALSDGLKTWKDKKYEIVQ